MIIIANNVYQSEKNTGLLKRCYLLLEQGCFKYLVESYNCYTVQICTPRMLRPLHRLMKPSSSSKHEKYPWMFANGYWIGRLFHQDCKKSNLCVSGRITWSILDNDENCIVGESRRQTFLKWRLTLICIYHFHVAWKLYPICTFCVKDNHPCTE